MDLAFAVRKNARTPVNSGMDGKLVIEINVRKKSGFDLVLRYEARTHTLAFLQMIRAIIFDLDNCLSAADEVGQELMAPVFDAIRKSNKGTLSEAQLNRAFEDCWRIPLNVVAREHGFSSEMVDAGWAASLEVEVTSPMFGYGDLQALRDLPVLRFLVTTGFRRLQE